MMMGKKQFPINQAQQGQVLLIIVLVMVVTMTIALSVATRSIVNLRTSSEEENSQQAFSAAEAGIEKSISSGADVTGGFDQNNTQYAVNVTSVGNAGSFLAENGNVITQNEGSDIWLIPHEADGTINYAAHTAWNGNITLYWGSDNGSGCSDGAMEVFVLSGNSANPSLQHYAFDKCNARSNGFDHAGGAGSLNGVNFGMKRTIAINQGFLVRVIPIYKGTKIGVEPSAALPLQGNVIDSTGTSGETKRKISLYKSYPKLPAELFYTLLSP